MVTSPGGGGIVRRVCVKCGKLQIDLTGHEETVVEEPHLFFGRFSWLAPLQRESQASPSTEEPASNGDRNAADDYRFGQRPTSRRRPERSISA